MALMPDATPTLPLRTKLLYATSNVGSEALTRSRSLWLVYYYAPPADAGLPTLLPAIWIGVILAVGRLLGAFDEILVGYVSDRTNSRWGRRIPYIVAGAPLLAVFSFLVFTPPPDTGTAATAIYLFFVLELLFLFSTITGGPYEALLPQIASTSKERVSLQAIRVCLGIAGTAIGLVGSDLLVNHFGFRVMALTMAALALGCRYVGVAGVWKRARQTQTPVRIPIREALRATFTNVPFRVLLPTIVLFAIAFELLQAGMPFYAHAVVPDGSWLKPRVLLAIAIMAAVASVPLFSRIAHRKSKRAAYRASLLAAALAFPLLGIAGLLPGIPQEIQILVATALMGAPIGAHFLFPIPLTADVIDQDSARTKVRREATFLGAASFAERTATSIAPLLLVLLRLLGDTHGHTLGIRLVFPLAGAILLAAYLLFRRYDVPDDVRDRVAPQIEQPAATALPPPALAGA
jgi:GPH family glycoside/pentoside/hexuronide:cation symporter